MNAACQPPNAPTINGTSAGAKIAPMFAPVLKMPVATERSFGGNHSVTTRMAVGKFPDSPRPSAKRAVQKPVTERQSECDMAAKLQKTTEQAYALFVPIQLMSGPNTFCPMA